MFYFLLSNLYRVYYRENSSKRYFVTYILYSVIELSLNSHLQNFQQYLKSWKLMNIFTRPYPSFSVLHVPSSLFDHTMETHSFSLTLDSLFTYLTRVCCHTCDVGIIVRLSSPHTYFYVHSVWTPSLFNTFKD